MTSTRYIGLMSGTSLDGVDAVLTDIHEGVTRTLASYYEPYPDGLQKALKSLCSSPAWDVIHFARTEASLSEFYAHCCNTLLAQSDCSHQSVRAIGCHGQTIRHLPDMGFTYQLLNASLLAEKTGIAVVGDFRRRDMAKGGQGAPLLPSFHHALAASLSLPIAFLNIGGIANITSINEARQVTGFDTGPGNTLIDNYCQQFTSIRFDARGETARSGSVKQESLEFLASDPYFSKPAPKSTGPEYFNLERIGLSHEKSEYLQPSVADMLCTLTELTARTIADAIKAYVPSREIYVFGGGIHNLFLMERLAKRLPRHTLLSSMELGIDPDFMEATAFAWLAQQFVEGKPSSLPSVTGASGSAILGSLYPAG
jgi:anhydro-N-acetylmuramic acid kinase